MKTRLKTFFNRIYLTPHLGYLTLALYLIILNCIRAEYITGWGFLGPAEALRNIEEYGLSKAFFIFLHKSFDYGYWNSTNSLIYGYGAGVLNLITPSIHWSTLLSALTGFLSIYIVSKTLKVSVNFLSWTVLSFSVLACFFIVPYPYISCLLPYSCSLYLIFSYSSKAFTLKNSIFELILWILTFEIARNSYDMGRTFFICPLLASLSLRNLSLKRRAALFTIGGACAYLFPKLGGTNSSTFVDSVKQTLLTKDLSFSFLSEIADSITLITSFLGYLPLSLGILGLAFLQKNRRFWIFLFLSHLALILLGAVSIENFIRPRRLLIILFDCLLIISLLWQQSSQRIRLCINLVVALGVLSTFHQTQSFFIDPISNRSLPWIKSQADLFINKNLIDDYGQIADFIQKTDGTHYLLYGYSTYAENLTDPAALPERLFLKLGPEEFKKKVRLVDHKQCRYSCIKSFDRVLAMEKKVSDTKPIYFYSYRKTTVKGKFAGKEAQRFFRDDSYSLLPSKFYYFDLFLAKKISKNNLLDIPVLKIDHQTLFQNPFISKELEHFQSLKNLEFSKHKNKPNLEVRLVDHSSVKYKTTSSPKAIYIKAETNIKEEGIYVLNVEVDDEVRVKLNNLIVFESFDPKAPSSFSEIFTLKKGPLRMEVEYTNINGQGNLDLVIYNKKSGLPVTWEARKKDLESDN